MSDAPERTLEPTAADEPTITGTAAARGLTLVEMAEQLAGALRGAGADLLYGVPGGGANLDMVGAAESAGCRFVLTHTETAAAIMAGVTAELTGQPSALVVTRGPGAASAVNGAAQALLDRQPIVVITDCVTIADRQRVSHQRLDQGAMMGAATKASLCLGPHDTAATAAVVLALATSGRPGPVHVDVDPTAPPPLSHERRRLGDAADPAAALEAARRALRDARRPVVIVGVGALATPRHRRSATVAALRRFVSGANVPVLTTYKGRGLVADSSGGAAGVATGATIESAVLDGADLIVGIGLDPVELIPDPWTYPAPVVLLGSWGIDDSTFFGDRVVVEVVGDLGTILDDLTDDVSTDWESAAGAEHRQAARRRLPGRGAGLASGPDASAGGDRGPPGRPGGHHRHRRRRGAHAGGRAAAALVHPERHVVCFTGDGGLGMALAELETLARLGLRVVVVVVFNDATLSLIAIKQRPEGHGGEGAVRYAPIDFAAIGTACGLASQRVSDVAQYEQALRQALDSDGPTLLDVAVDPSAYPAVIDVIRGSRRPAT